MLYFILGVFVVIVLFLVGSMFLPERCDECGTAMIHTGTSVHAEAEWRCPSCGHECQELFV